MFGKQMVAVVLRGAGARAVWLRGSPGSLELVKAVAVAAAPDEALGAIIARLRAEKVPVGELVLGIPGSAATLRYHRLPPVPDWRLQLILKYETEEMAEKSGEPLSSDALALEIPESVGDDEVHLLGMGKEHSLAPAIHEIETAGGRVGAAIPSAIGLVHAYLGSHLEPPAETVLLADLGEAESHLAIVREGRLLFARTVSFGTGELDDLIGRRLDLKIDEARLVRERAASGRLPEELASGVEATVRSWTGQLGQLVASSVTFCRAQTRVPALEIDRLLLAGEGAALALRQRAPSEGMPARVEALAPKLGGAALPGSAEEWAPAVGLAAAPLDPRRRYLDLLPAAFRKKRDFRTRTRFLWGAAAALLLAVIVQFAAGVVEQGRASDARRTAAEWNAKMSTWDRNEAAAQRANQKFENREHRLRDEVRTGSFHAEILGVLARELPDAISVTSIQARRAEEAGEVGTEIVIEGLSDNSRGEGIDHARTLQSILDARPGLRRNQIDLGDLAEGSYSFKLTSSPDEKMPESSSRTSRPRPGRGRP